MQFREHQVESEQSNLYKFQCNSAMIGNDQPRTTDIKDVRI